MSFSRYLLKGEYAHRASAQHAIIALVGRRVVLVRVGASLAELLPLLVQGAARALQHPLVARVPLAVHL